MDTPQMYSVGPPKASNFSGKLRISQRCVSRVSLPNSPPRA